MNSLLAVMVHLIGHFLLASDAMEGGKGGGGGGGGGGGPWDGGAIGAAFLEDFVV